MRPCTLFITPLSSLLPSILSRCQLLRVPLHSASLQILALGLGDPRLFPFLDSPPLVLVDGALRALKRLQACSPAHHTALTGLGSDARSSTLVMPVSMHHSCPPIMFPSFFPLPLAATCARRAFSRQAIRWPDEWQALPPPSLPPLMPAPPPPPPSPPVSSTALVPAPSPSTALAHLALSSPAPRTGIASPAASAATAAALAFAASLTPSPTSASPSPLPPPSPAASAATAGASDSAVADESDEAPMQLTPLGDVLSRLPIDVTFGKMLVLAVVLGGGGRGPGQAGRAGPLEGKEHSKRELKRGPDGGMEREGERERRDDLSGEASEEEEEKETEGRGRPPGRRSRARDEARGGSGDEKRDEAMEGPVSFVGKGLCSASLTVYLRLFCPPCV